MKKNRVFTGDFIEILKNSELRNVVGGGYDNDPYGRTECCSCSYTITWVDGTTLSNSGIFCGSYGDSDCQNGISNWLGQQGELYDDLKQISYSC